MISPVQQNIAFLCEQSLSPKTMNTMINNAELYGLVPERTDNFLAQGNYQAVLASLWSEQNQKKRLKWLTGKADQLYPVLLYELAIERFIALPTLDTMRLVSVPLFMAAKFRVLQDFQCTNEPETETEEIAKQISMIYQTKLKQYAHRLASNAPELPMSDRNMQGNLIKAKVLEVAQLSLAIDLPCPNWAGSGREQALITNEPNMRPERQWKQLRSLFARQTIQTLSQPSSVF